MRVTFSALGAAITGIFVPDKAGQIADVTVQAGGSAGKTIGRYANRIAGGELPINGAIYELAVNEGRNTLHGGPDGFSKRTWRQAQQSDASTTFNLHSPDGDQGFPGALECSIRYSWNGEGELRLEYRASADKPTAINLTNHVYFNLSGGRNDIARQLLQIDASAYTPLDGELIPTGEIARVAQTPHDFRVLREIGTQKFDVNFVLDGWNCELRRVAFACDPSSGRTLTVETTQPGVQLYTGKPGAFALETQHFADSPHHPNFPSTLLEPGEVFAATTVYRFGNG